MKIRNKSLLKWRTFPTHHYLRPTAESRCKTAKAYSPAGSYACSYLKHPINLHTYITVYTVETTDG